MFFCINCDKNFSFAYLYLGHIRNFHRHDPNFHYVCGFNDCPVTSDSFTKFKKHLIQHKDCKTDNVCIKFICSSCNFKTYLQSKFMSHLKNHEIIVCPIKNCYKTYSVYSSFSSHLTRYHSWYGANDFKSEYVSTLTKIPNLSVSQITEDTIPIKSSIGSEEVTHTDNSLQISQFKRNVVLFILKMQAKYLLPESTVNDLINDIIELQSDIISMSKQSIIKVFENNNFSDSVLSSVLDALPNDKLFSTFNIMKSKCLQKNYLNENLNFVEPVQCNLKLNKKISNYQYVPILKAIQAFCKNDEVLDYIMSMPQNSQVNILSDIYDGKIFKNSDIFQSFPNIQIVLYFDEFVVSNPLRGNQAKHKLAAFYYTLANIPVKYHSMVKDMQLAILCRSCDLKYFGFQAILKPLVEDIKILETEGIVISDIPCKVKGSIILVIGDNLAANQIGGYVTCFSGNAHCCRFCLASVNDMQLHFRDSLFVQRTKQMHNQHLALINMDPKYISTYGLRSESPLNSLKFFHTSTMLPPDAMHDLFEGIVPFEIGLIIKYLISKSYITLSQLNYKIKYSKFGLHDNENRPMELSDNFTKGIKMISSRIWCFLRFLPLLVGNYVPESDPVWHLLLMLKDIVDIVVAPKVNSSYIEYLSDLIRDHHCLFKELFPDEKIKPKFHFLVHYPRLIYEFGPLICSWSMRFESKHFYFKRISQSIKNSINLPYSLAKRHQQLQCYYNYECLRSVGKTDVITSGKIIDINNYPTEISEVLAGYEEFYSLTKIEINGIVYKTGMCLVSEFENDEPVSEKIIIILKKGNITKFVCRTYSSTTFFHIRGFKLNGSKGIKILSLQNFIDFYPLSIYRYQTYTVIIPKYLILNSAES